MTDYAAKEAKVLTKIGKEMDKLDVSLSKMEDTDSKVKHFFEQEKALHEVKSIIRKENKIDGLEDDAQASDAQAVSDWLNDQDSLVGKINQEIDKLETTLGGIGDDDNKVKSFVEQKKAIREIKEIVKASDKLDE